MALPFRKIVTPPALPSFSVISVLAATVRISFG
jgi:hypothetical protein